ncbi:MAG: peptidoglycan DD-metalloendopeptidase family protein [Candidatus Kapabacteria bacterium]|nr:peptidoglycan DD-metalloendopeptidase family protein [Candidatus Kapabacteria bacterium]
MSWSRWLTCMALAMACMLQAGLAQSIDQQKRDLERMRTSIQETRKRIDALTRREASAMQSLTAIQRRQSNLVQLIASMETDLSRLQDSARSVEAAIASTRTRLDRVRDEYSRTSANLLALRTRKSGSPQGTAAQRSLYRSLSASVDSYRRSMRELEDSLESQKSLLSTVTSVQSSILQARAAEQRSLNTTLTQRQRELERLRKDKSLLARELRQKQASANKMRGIISDLVAAEERRRRDADARAKEKARERAKEQARADAQRPPDGTPPHVKARPPAESTTDDDVVTGPRARPFSGKSLPWPVASRNILHGYGTYSNAETGTQLENPGIDISCADGTSVSCVAAGMVSSVSWLPGFGSVVIVDHNNGYRTVYANLSSVTVRKGAMVQAGTRLGASGESVDGAFVHFEIWNGRERRNPMAYLR